jgi:hypothetical protein
MAMVREHPSFSHIRMKLGVMPDFSGSDSAKQETPVGVMDGVNKIFALLNKPLKDSETVVKDGMVMKEGLDYTIDFNLGQIAFSDNQVPQAKSVVHVTYKFMRQP